jgi:hypothetical protein
MAPLLEILSTAQHWATIYYQSKLLVFQCRKQCTTFTLHAALH